MALHELLYGAYGRLLERSLDRSALPRHVGIILDGNRRWAKAFGTTTAHGHRAGADKIQEVLQWCDDEGIEVVTLYLLSTDNLRRPQDELAPLIEIVEDAVARVAATRRWKVHPVGALDLLPQETADRIRELQRQTADVGKGVVNVAIGYGGRQEIADAVRALLLEHAAKGTSIEELAEVLQVDHIAAHLYTKGQPDPDLVIRTSGEQRLSGFLLWQSAHSEFWFCDAHWPDFRKVDFLRALRAYAARERRFGS